MSCRDEVTGGDHKAKNLPVRHWALLTVLLYGAACVVLAPHIFISQWPYLPWEEQIWPSQSPALPIYRETPFWLVVDLLMVLQAIFLLLPIDVARKKPVTRRHWVVMAIVAALMMGLLMFGLVLTVGEMAMYSPYAKNDWVHRWVVLVAVALALLTWAAWSLIFLQKVFSNDPGRAFQRVLRILLIGCIAELLLGVPYCVNVSRWYKSSYDKDTWTTFLESLGLIAGLTVLLFASWASVFSFFVANERRSCQKGNESAATKEEDETKRLSPHTRDAVVWLAVAGGFVLIVCASLFLLDSHHEERDFRMRLPIPPVPLHPLPSASPRFFQLDSEDQAVLAMVCGVAAIVLVCKSVHQTWRAARDDEPRWYGMCIALLVVLALVLLAFCWDW
ncbi:MAG: hypothetical protein ABSE73_07255 [Planctomycetota bacterium]